MRGIDAGVDDLNDLSTPILSGRRSSGHPRGGAQSWRAIEGPRTVVVIPEVRVGHRFVRALDKGSLHALRRPDSREGGARRPQRKSLECVGIVPQSFDAGAGDRPGHFLGDALLGLGKPGRLIARPLLEVDDDRDRRAIAFPSDRGIQVRACVVGVGGCRAHGGDDEGTRSNQRPYRHCWMEHLRPLSRRLTNGAHARIHSQG